MQEVYYCQTMKGLLETSLKELNPLKLNQEAEKLTKQISQAHIQRKAVLRKLHHPD